MPRNTHDNASRKIINALRSITQNKFNLSDMDVIQSALDEGKITISSGERSVAAGGISNSIIITGDNISFNLTSGATELLKQTAIIPFDINQYIGELNELYKKSQIKDRYVSLEGFIELETGRCRNIDVDQYVTSWLNGNSMRRLVILGDYGTGKSWLCLRLAKHLADLYCEAPQSNPLPLLIGFKRYKPDIDLEKLIRLELFEGYGVEIKNPAAFRKCLQLGAVLPILDGLDEMAKVLDEHKAFIAYSGLDIFSEIPKVLVTCRTHFFYSGSEEREVLDSSEKRYLIKNISKSEKLHLNLLNRSKIIECIERRFDNSRSQDIIKLIGSTYNLTELCSRPVLLSLFCESYNSFPGFKDTMSPADLYETYIDSWLEREFRAGRLQIEPREVNEFFEDLAEYMVKKDTMIIDIAELKQHLSELLEKLQLVPNKWIDIERQLITSGFVRRSVSDGWEFAHRSFEEFFYAKKFFRWEHDCRGEGEFPVVHTPIWQFVAQMVLTKWNEQKVLFWIKPRINRSDDPTLTKTTLRAAAAYSMLKGRQNLQSYNFQGIMLDSVDLRGLHLNKCVLSFADFHSSDLQRAKFIECDLSNVNFKDAILRYASLINCNLSNSRFEGADLRNVKLIECDVSHTDFREANFGQSQSSSLSRAVDQLKKCYGYEIAYYDDNVWADVDRLENTKEAKKVCDSAKGLARDLGDVPVIVSAREETVALLSDSDAYAHKLTIVPPSVRDVLERCQRRDME